jgi:peptidoglycan/xylan/chitin deacetylase (PgdA/CDA1 family)
VFGRLASRALSELRRRRSVIVGYHSVGASDPAEDPHYLRVPPARFREQIGLLRKAGFEFTTVAELAGRSSEPGLAALSFDDGMSDNHSILLPLLLEEGIAATVFVTTGLIGQANPWMGPGSAARMMTEDELRDLVSHGIELGAHTVNHLDMSELDEETCLREMVESRDRLEQISGVPVKTFAYPFCRFGPAAVTAAGKAGFIAAVTCEGRGSWAPLELRRAMLTGRDGVPSFVSKLCEIYQPVYDSGPGRAIRTASRRVRHGGGVSARP